MGLAELVVVLICIGASFIAGLCGMGAFMISIPVMAMVLPIHTAVLACSMAGPGLSLMLFVRYGRHCRWRSLLPMLIGAVPGALVGVLIIAAVEGRVL